MSSFKISGANPIQGFTLGLWSALSRKKGFQATGADSHEEGESNSRSLKEDSGGVRHGSPILCRDSDYACGVVRL
jgi:hypothetical protein